MQLLYGLHTVREAIRNPDRVLVKLLATENGALRLSEGGTLPITPTIVDADEISKQLPPDSVHQGLLLIAEPLFAPSMDDVRDDGVVLLLDQITDPHNVGAILRSAAAFGVTALITTQRHSPEVTGVLAKAASGALEHVPIISVQNLARTLASLGERGFVRVGLDSDGASALGGLTLKAPLALVLGAEGKGLRPVTRENCDHIARLDMPGAIKSLNVSNAAAVALYAVTERLTARADVG
jgi:23S rRNA (guanosine2251-2'-O)-methyltransferase